MKDYIKNNRIFTWKANNQPYFTGAGYLALYQ